MHSCSYLQCYVSVPRQADVSGRRLNQMRCKSAKYIVCLQAEKPRR